MARLTQTTLPGKCIVSQGGYFTSFDSAEFQLKSTCGYALAMDSSRSKRFKVRKTRRSSCITWIFIILFDIISHISRKFPKLISLWWKDSYWSIGGFYLKVLNSAKNFAGRTINNVKRSYFYRSDHWYYQCMLCNCIYWKAPNRTLPPQSTADPCLQAGRQGTMEG